MDHWSRWVSGPPLHWRDPFRPSRASVGHRSLISAEACSRPGLFPGVSSRSPCARLAWAMPCLFVAWMSVLISDHSRTSASHPDFRLLELSLLPTKAIVLSAEFVP